MSAVTRVHTHMIARALTQNQFYLIKLPFCMYLRKLVEPHWRQSNILVITSLYKYVTGDTGDISSDIYIMRNNYETRRIKVLFRFSCLWQTVGRVCRDARSTARHWNLTQNSTAICWSKSCRSRITTMWNAALSARRGVDVTSHVPPIEMQIEQTNYRHVTARMYIWQKQAGKTSVKTR